MLNSMGPSFHRFFRAAYRDANLPRGNALIYQAAVPKAKARLVAPGPKALIPVTFTYKPNAARETGKRAASAILSPLTP
jgi:hypothetical protein